MITEILVILALIMLNGVLAMSELAVVSARPARLKPLEGKSSGARMALRLAENPGRFLSTVQIGITAVGVLSGALAGDTLGQRLAIWLAETGMDPVWSKRIGVGGVVVGITYFSLIIGELVPKQLALKNPEAVATRVAPIMAWLSIIAAPLVWFLERSGRLVLWALHQGGSGDSRVTEEEVHILLAEAQEGGVLEDEEHVMMTGVMRLADRVARSLMTPRQDIEMLPLNASSAEAVEAIAKIARPRMPVVDEAGDVVGVVRMTDVFLAVSRREDLDLRRLLRDLPVISDRMEALDVVEVLQRSEDHMALVYDEYGDFEGIITTADLLQAITGAVASSDADEPALMERDDGSLLVAGWMPADEFCDRLGLPRHMAGDYGTVAGLVLHQLGHMPVLGEVFTADNHRFEVIDLDGLRIDKVLVSALPPVE